MGFTPLPPEASAKGIAEVYAFIAAHGDIIAHHFDAGVPWEEAHQGKDFSANLGEDWQRRLSNTPPGLKRYVAITPLNILRNGLAPYWGKTDNMPLPESWAASNLDDARVKKAFLDYALRAAEAFKPDFLAIGIEVNMLIGNAPDLWPRYLALHEFVYKELKRKYPALPVFATIQYDWLRGIDGGSRGSRGRQMPEVQKLARLCDLIALSSYQFGPSHNPLRRDFFAQALSFHKPVAIAECGALARDLVIGGKTLRATESDQEKYVSFFLRAATDNRFVFVINFVAIDYDRLFAQLSPSISDPGLRDLWSVWVSTGLSDATGRPKPSLRVWDAYRALPLSG